MIGRHILFPEELWEKLLALEKLTGNKPSQLVRQFVIAGVKDKLSEVNNERR
tara:strand:+ start:78 stop:233 length:156 start_codon:yes stop_codon:yes gene_type:complete